MLYSPRRTVRAATSCRLMLQRESHADTGDTCHLLGHAVCRGQDVLPGDERAAAELATVLQQRRDPRPLALVRRPAVDHLEGVLVVVVEPLLLLRHHAVLGVADGRVLAHAAGGGVAGAGAGRALGRGGLLRGRHRGGGVRAGRAALGRGRGAASRGRVAASTLGRGLAWGRVLSLGRGLARRRILALWRVLSLWWVLSLRRILSLRRVLALGRIASAHSREASSYTREVASDSGKSSSNSREAASKLLETSESSKLSAAESHFPAMIKVNIDTPKYKVCSVLPRGGEAEVVAGGGHGDERHGAGGELAQAARGPAELAALPRGGRAVGYNHNKGTHGRDLF